MKIGFISPFPPIVSGVAVYSNYLIKALNNLKNNNEYIPIEWNRCLKENYKINIYCMGNHPIHEYIYKESIKKPSIVFLHDINIHNLIRYMTISKGKIYEYINYLLNEGNICNSDISELLYKDENSIIELINKYNLINEIICTNNHFIVHSEFAKNTIKSINNNANILLIPHINVWKKHIKRDFEKKQFKIGVFGYISKNRGVDFILKSFSIFLKEQRKYNYILYFVGNVVDLNMESLVEKYNLNNNVKIINNTDDNEFLKLMQECDIGINIRYPYGGEMSMNLIKMMGYGIPVAIIKEKSFCDIPENSVYSIDKNSIVESLVEFYKMIENKREQLIEIGNNAFKFIDNLSSIDNIAYKIDNFVIDTLNYKMQSNCVFKKYNFIKMFKYRKHKIIFDLIRNIR